MSVTGRKSEPPTQAQDKPQGVTDKSKKRQSSPRAGDDDDDGDIATPKQDRDGNDDEPL
jgi:hypothetical protein